NGGESGTPGHATPVRKECCTAMISGTPSPLRSATAICVPAATCSAAVSAVHRSLPSLPETARSTASPERSAFSTCCGSKQFTQQLAALQEEKMTSGASVPSSGATAGVMVTLDQSLFTLPP